MAKQAKNNLKNTAKNSVTKLATDYGGPVGGMLAKSLMSKGTMKKVGKMFKGLGKRSK